MSSPACCRHCGRPKVNRPRGLCWTCFRDREIRERYPAMYNQLRPRDGVPDFMGKARPTQPTAELPGTSKVEELRRRAQAQEDLWHRQDARPDAEGATADLERFLGEPVS